MNTSKQACCKDQLKTPCCKCTTNDCRTSESCSCKKELRFCTSCKTPNCANHTLNVLLWNIHGDGGISARKLVVEGVVKELDPDVILLQEVRSNPLIQQIIMKGGYGIVKADKEDEAQILYKTNKFQPPNMERRILETTIDKVVNTQEMQRTLRSQTKPFTDRISMVRLTTKEYNLNFVFLSFHNERRGQHSSEQFCQIVSQISTTTQCIVIAGADANYKLPFGECNGCTVLEYDATERRRGKEIDHFIVAPLVLPPGIDQKVEALNFVDTKVGQGLHPLMTSLKPKLKSIKYHEVLDEGLDKKKDDALHKALDRKLEGNLDESLVKALRESLEEGLEEGLKEILDEPQLRKALLKGFKKTLHEALDQGLCIDEGTISNHDPILLRLTINTKESQ